MLQKGDFSHCSLFCPMLNLWSYWACIKSGKNWEHLPTYIGWNLFYLKRRWPDSYFPFEIVYEKIKNQDKVFRPGYFAPRNAKHYRYFLQSLNY